MGPVSGPLLTRSRRLLVALVLACSGLVLTSLPAHACSCVHQTVKQQAKAADAVFRGVVTKAPKPGKKDQVRTYSVTVDRVYSGSLVTDSVEVTSAVHSATCGITLDADKRYIFFARERGAQLKVNLCGGTDRATTTLTHKVVSLLGDGKQPQPPAPRQATFTRADDADPPALTRLMAPGGALLLVSLLGLAVVRRRARRTA